MSSDSFWDSRALALFRIGLGVYLIWYGALCLYWGNTFFTDFGVLPMSVLNGLSDQKGWGSLYLASRWWVWAYVLLVAQLFLSFSLAAGYRVALKTPVLAYLLWSLNARNPFISGLAEDWLVLLVVVSGLVPTTRKLSLDDGAVWFQEKEFFKTPRVFLTVTLFLAIPGAWMGEQIFTDPGSPGTWLGLTGLAGMLVPARYAPARNLGVLMFAVWVCATWQFHCLTLLGLLVGLAFIRLTTPPGGPDSYSLFFLPALLALVLQTHWLAYRLGWIQTPFPERIREQTSTDHSMDFEFSDRADGLNPQNLFHQLQSDSILMVRYLNRLYQQTEETLFVNLMSYQAREHENQNVDETRVYNVLLRTDSGPERLFQVQTVPTSRTIWETMPALDRNPLQ